MDAEKQKALDYVKDKDNRGYDVNGVKCFTATEVNAAWKDVPDAAIPPVQETIVEKPKHAAGHK